MIRIRKKAAAPVPGILQTTGKAATIALNQRYDNGERNFGSSDFDSGIYGHSEVKRSLIEIQGYKCCFCESKIGHISYGDVEHFRPKTGWVQNTETLNKPGYYWLAYDWDNLLLSCDICNRPNKKNYFPLKAGSPRALSHHQNVNTEQHLFIHPANEDPETSITFKEEIPIAIGGNIRGQDTISKLGLDREMLNEQRRKTLNIVRDIYELAKGYPDTNSSLKEMAKNKVIKYKNESTRDETEYASMLRSFFRDNPINF